MGLIIRPATTADGLQWVNLAHATLGDTYPAKELYDPIWVAPMLDPSSGEETWVADTGDRLQASISFLKPWGPTGNPVANLGRNLIRKEAITDGSAEALLKAVTKIAMERGEMAIIRIAATDNAQQILFENLDFVCVGFQPLKHMLQQREGVLFYVSGASSVLVSRSALSESLPQVSELSGAALENLDIPNNVAVRDGACGYPLQSDLTVHEAVIDDYELWRAQAETANPPLEVSGRFNCGFGLLRLPVERVPRAFLGQRGEKMTAGMNCYFDDADRCVRITEAFCSDDISMGALLSSVVKSLQQQYSAVYTEIDVLASAPRLLKSAEQLGFVPVAYLPAFHCRNGRHFDVVKMVKLNVTYSLEAGDFTAHAKKIVQIVDRNFEDQKLGMAIINLLRPLSMFSGLGDGELRKIARLFVQKLFRPEEQVFAKGDSGDEAYVVLRGKINIQLEHKAPPVAQLGDGKIFGERAFLDGAPRAAYAVAGQPSILLVMKRDAFTDLCRHEPTLGMVVMRNLAQDLAVKLRSVNESLTGTRRFTKP
jgi:hypothetical protein